MKNPANTASRTVRDGKLIPYLTLVGALLALPAPGLTDTGVSANAPDKAFYLGFGEDCCGEDPHPVHGIATTDGGYAVVGKSMDSSGNQDGFILKFNAGSLSGTSFVESEQLSNMGWSNTIGSSGNMDGLNNVASVGDAIFASGFIYTSSGSIDRYLVKYNLATGNKVWEASFADPIGSRDGAYESMVVTSDGGLALTGVRDAEPGSLEGFKSYGNPSSGSAFVDYFSAEQLASDNAPQGSTWSTELPGANSGKGIRELPSGGFVVAALGAEEGPGHAFRLSASGEVNWVNQYPEHGEITDLSLLSQNGTVTGIALVGHYRPSGGGIDGSVTRLNLSGEIIWHKGVGDPAGGIAQFAGLGSGNPNLIFDECWGIQGTSDGGMILACGTGIEGCGEYSPGSAIHTECMGDPRRTWRGYLVKLDQDGNEVWHRTDSFLEPGEPEAADSASEYVALKSDGSVVSIVDQGFGIGVLVLNPESGNAPGDNSGTNDDNLPDDELPDNNEDENTDDEDNEDNEDESDNTVPDTEDSDESNTESSDDSSNPSSGCSANSTENSGHALIWLLLGILSFVKRPRQVAP